MQPIAASPPACELHIASTWDGLPIAVAEQARLRLRLWPHELRIALTAPFHGDPPPSGPPGPTPQLWEHEVIEVYVAGIAPAATGPSYTEIELSPWGHHLVLRLEGIRTVTAEGLPLDLRVSRRSGRWLAAARLDRRWLPSPPWRINAFAIHGSALARRFLAAAALPGTHPDFHQPEQFPTWNPACTE